MPPDDRRASRASVIPRRDDRAEPDDDDLASGRVDVVSFERESAASSGVGALRRELARLHQQASAVERSIEDQRRERKDYQDRLDRATERIVQLESRLTSTTAEAANLQLLHEKVLEDMQALRSERDDLARAVEAAKVATTDIGKYRNEAEDQRIRAERLTKEIVKLEADITDLKKKQFQEALKVTDKDTELGSARAKLARANEEAEQAKSEAVRAKAELDRLRAELDETKETIGKAQAEAAAARTDAASARDDAARARDEAAKARDEAQALRDEVTRAKEDIVRDRATARDRIDMLERALDDARAVSTRWESDYEALRMERETEARRAADELTAANATEARVRRELEDALTAAAQADERANTAVAARTALEDAVLRVRDDVAAAFSRLDGAAASPFTTRSPSILPRGFDGLSPAAIPAPPHTSPGVGGMIAAASNPSTAPASIDEDWSSPDSDEPGTRPGLGTGTVNELGGREGSEPPPSSAARSVPPPVGSSASAVASPAPLAPVPTIPPAMYASVPPQVHEAHGEPAPDSTPPPSRKVTMPPPAGMAPADVDEAAKRPSASVPRGSVFPPAEGGAVREELFSKLVDPAHASEAALELKSHGEWLQGRPPPTFMAALAAVDYDAEGAIFDLARAWEREPLCQALVGALRSEPDSRLREHTAWLLKHLGSASQAKAIADFARSDTESVQTRRWLLEALDRLAAGRSIGWKEVGECVSAVGRHDDPMLRDGVVGLLVALDRSDEKRKALLEILRADDDEGVIANAVNGLASVLPIELDPSVVERLLGHPSPRVQRSVRELIERAKQR
ncbi:MAG: hypothetical protein JST00_43515 [Deltaproteobacteria bacterium]|nr:hypothetical protein [Deltaproteobacteria bacterium]